MEDLQSIINNLTFEKVALDQTLVKQIQDNLELRKSHLIKDRIIEDLKKQCDELLAEKAEIKPSLAVIEKTSS